MPDSIDDILSDEHLRNTLRERAASMTDEEIRALVAPHVTDEILRGQMLAIVPELMQEAREKNPNLTEDQLSAQEEALRQQLTRPESLADLRASILNNPELIRQIREGIESPESIQKIREEISNSTTFAVSRAVVKAFDDGHVDAGIWGLTSAGQFAIAQGSTSRIAGLLSLGGRVPVAGTVVVGLVEAFGVPGISTGFVQDYQEGRTAEANVKLGGAVGGIAGTALAGAATLGVLATAPAIVPLAVAGAIGVTCYYTGRNVATIINTIGEINEIAGHLDSQCMPDPTAHRNLRNAIPQILMNSYGGDRGEELKKIVREINGMGADDWVRPEDVARAMSHPERGGEAVGKVRELLQARREFFQQVENDNYSWRPRFVAFTSAQADRDQKWEDARIRGREMDSALGELDGYVAQTVAVRREAQAQAAEVLRPFNNLDAGVQAMITMSLESNYPAYRRNEEDAGRIPLDRDSFILAKKVEAASNPEMIAALNQTEQAILGMAAGNGDMATTLRREAVLNPEQFQRRLAAQQQQPQPRQPAPTAQPVEAAPATQAPAQPTQPTQPTQTQPTQPQPPAQPASLSAMFNQAASLAQQHNLGIVFSLAASAISILDNVSFLKPATDWLKTAFVNHVDEELVNQGVNMLGATNTEPHADGTAPENERLRPAVAPAPAMG